MSKVQTIITEDGDLIIYQNILYISYSLNHIGGCNVIAHFPNDDFITIRSGIYEYEFKAYVLHIIQSIDATNSFNADLYNFSNSVKSNNYKNENGEKQNENGM